METYISHFLEAAWFPKAPVLARRKVNFTLRPAKSADIQVDRVPPPSQCLGPETTTLIILSYLICSHLHKNTNQPVYLYGAWALWFWCGALTLLGLLEGLRWKSRLFCAQIALSVAHAISGPKTGSTFNATLTMAQVMSRPQSKS